jgi:hypothetical protein
MNCPTKRLAEKIKAIAIHSRPFYSNLSRFCILEEHPTSLWLTLVFLFKQKRYVEKKLGLVFGYTIPRNNSYTFMNVTFIHMLTYWDRCHVSAHGRDRKAGRAHVDSAEASKGQGGSCCSVLTRVGVCVSSTAHTSDQRARESLVVKKPRPSGQRAASSCFVNQEIHPNLFR